MSTATGGDSGRWDVSRFHRWTLVENTGRILMIAGLLPSFGWDNLWSQVAGSILCTVGLVAVLGGSWMWGVHQRGLCTVCAVEFPLDPAADALRRRRALRLYHWVFGSMKRSFGISGAMVAVMVVLIWLSTKIHMNWIGTAWLLLMGLFGIAATTAVSTHSRLAPWCPYCRHGRGEDDDDVEPVVPEPTAPGRSRS